MLLTKMEILAGLRQFGIKAGDKYVVHSSLSSMGYVEGGADTVIDAMIESVSPGGTVFVPTSMLATNNGKTGVKVWFFNKKKEELKK